MQLFIFLNQFRITYWIINIVIYTLSILLKKVVKENLTPLQIEIKFVFQRCWSGPIAEQSNLSFELGCGRGNPSSNPTKGKFEQNIHHINWILH